MQNLQFYRANKNNTGVAVSFNFGQKRDKSSLDLYISGIKQSGWNAQTMTGSFKGSADDPSKNINMKFSDTEVGGIIYALENQKTFSAYHKSPAGATTASVRPYIPEKIKSGQDWVANTNKVSQGVSITIKKDGENAPSFPLTLNFGEAITLAVYLRAGLTDKFLNFVPPSTQGNEGNTAPNRTPQRTQQKPQPQPQDDAGDPDAGETSENLDEDVPF